LGTTNNFILKTVADQLSQDAAQKPTPLPPITTVNCELLHATDIVRYTVHMWESIGSKLRHVYNFVVADFAHFNVISCMAWLYKQHPDIH
jgi:hypothetical protein